MGIRRRIGSLVNVRRLRDAPEDPGEVLDLVYTTQLTALQRVRRSVAEVLTAQRQLEVQERQMEASQERLDALARTAVGQGRDDVAAGALTQQELIATQLESLRRQMAAMSQQLEGLETAGRRLQSRVVALRTQKEALKAQYSAAQASVDAGESVSGIAHDIEDVELLLARARDRMLQTQARAQAVEELVDSGVLGRLDASGLVDPLEAGLREQASRDAVERRIASMKRELGLPAGGSVPAAGTGAADATSGGAVTGG